MHIGRITLRRFNGIETYSLISARMMLFTNEHGRCINLTIDADSNGSKTTSDTVDYPAAPNAEVTIYHEQLDLDRLVGRRFNIQSAYDETIGDHVSRFYYYEHEDLDDNVVEFVDRDADGRYQVSWSGTTIDPNYYDGSKPATIVEIEGFFSVDT